MLSRDTNRLRRIILAWLVNSHISDESNNEALTGMANRCLQYVIDMHATINQLNREMTSRNLLALNMGMGINSGPVVVGNVGSVARKQHSALTKGNRTHGRPI